VENKGSASGEMADCGRKAELNWKL